jgi:predicted AlkP superfamily pyrophosphatase or phosphodiesterase
MKLVIDYRSNCNPIFIKYHLAPCHSVHAELIHCSEVALLSRTVRTLLLFFLAGIVVASAPPKKPRLVLAIVIDQFRYDYLLRFRDEYTSGLAHLLKDGAVFTDAHYLQAATVTAVGHSTFLSGATPSMSGIIGNDWYDRESGKVITSVYDPATKTVGGIPGAVGSSPRRMLVSTVGDELKMRNSDSKVFGVSIKDRSAILPVGHMADGAYWYDPDSAHWVTSTYYRSVLPDWTKKLNDEKTYQRYVGAKWLPFDAKDESAKPFCTMVAGTEDRYCGGLEATPWGNDMIEEFAERAIAAENLGRHAGSDILAISFSANDYVGHAVGPDDPAVRDISIRTDRLLGKLFDYVEQRVGAGNTLVVLTADHGVAPVPEVNQSRKMPGGRLSDGRLAMTITDALTKRFGPGKWLLPGAAAMPYLNLELVHSRRLNLAEVERVAAEAARTQDHIARVYTAYDLQEGAVQRDDIGRAFSLGFFGPRSGDLFILPEPYYLFESTGTSHGTPYGYDAHVPVVFLGAGIKPGAYSQRIAVNDIAPTLAALLEVEQPSGSSGHILREILE